MVVKEKTIRIVNFAILSFNDKANFYLLLIHGDSESIKPLFPVVSNKASIALAVAPYVATTDHLLL